MKLLDVYTLFDLEPVRGSGCHVYTADNTKYLDFYGGHAVISIGHSHPVFVENLTKQAQKIIFYSNSVQNSLQEKLAKSLGEVSNCEDYDLFLCNSGAEAVENALKVASFGNGRTKILAIKNGFHGRTSAAVNSTWNDKIKANINRGFETVFIDMNDHDTLQEHLNSKTFAAVIIEPVQGVGGLDKADLHFLQNIEKYCAETDTIFISDEVQSGFGRTGKFFAFQHADVSPQVITMAKGMGNGFPVGGILVKRNTLNITKGMLGTTFGGNHLACTAVLSVLEVMKAEKLLDNATNLGAMMREGLSILKEVKQVKGQGLMVGAEFDFPVKRLREILLYDQRLFTGNASNPNVLRLLPPLNITEENVADFFGKLTRGLEQFKHEMYEQKRKLTHR
ncbi:MAG: acetylornithine/N-succinyldiaminopimelate aminotransferase [Saprospiraceae bacterium]|jgi:acetylornithine/N-succinyldiaminopimelate aminotransferase